LKLRTYILLSLLTIFSFKPSHAQLMYDEMGDSDTLLVQEKLQKVTGRIIHVVRTTSYTLITNVCTAMLVGEDTVVTSGHCFKRNLPLTTTDTVKKFAFDLTSLEDFYFDIPGVTSENLGEDIAKLLSNKNEFKVPLNNKVQLNQLLASIPKIKNVQILREYTENMPVTMSEYKPKTEKQTLYLENFERNYQWNFLGNIYDMAVAKLSKKLPPSTIVIGDLDKNNDNIYASGFFGGDLNQRLRVFKCSWGRSVLESLLPLTEYSSFIKFVGFSNQLIVSQCDGEIVEGESGGPQVQVKNGEIYLVGINSATIYGLDDHVISPIASSLKSKFKF
jgi:hypothetical protein